MKYTHYPVTYRNATLADLDGILRVEQSWPESGRAGADKFVARLERFPQGFFVACIGDAGNEAIIAMITSMPVFYDPRDVGSYRDWSVVTNNGYLFEDPDLAGCNAIYIVSGVIDTAYRGMALFEPGVLHEVRLAHDLGMRYVVGGAVIPGYKRYCDKHGETDAYAYCLARSRQQLVDPLLAMYEGIGFHVGGPRHVIRGYYPDDASRNYAALVVRDLQTTPL